MGDELDLPERKKQKVEVPHSVSRTGTYQLWHGPYFTETKFIEFPSYICDTVNAAMGVDTDEFEDYDHENELE